MENQYENTEIQPGTAREVTGGENPGAVMDYQPKAEPDTKGENTPLENNSPITKENPLGTFLENVENGGITGFGRMEELLEHKDIQLKEMEQLLGYSIEKEIDFAMEKDLKEIQAIDRTVACIEDLPEEYLAIRFNPLMPTTATQAFLAVQAFSSTARKPPSTGAVSGGVTDREFFTGEELDRLTKAQLSDPEIMAKAMRSIEMLK